MKRAKIYFNSVVAALVTNGSPAVAQAAPSIGIPMTTTCGQYTPCCPPSTKISRDGDWKAEQQIPGNVTSSYRLSYTMKPLLHNQMGAFANYLASTGVIYTVIMRTNVYTAGSGSTPVPTTIIGIRLDKWDLPFSGTSTNSLHGSLSNYTLTPNTWYVLESSFDIGGIVPLDCGVQKFAYRVEYKPMKTITGAPIGPSVTVVPFEGALPKSTMAAPQ